MSQQEMKDFYKLQQQQLAFLRGMNQHLAALSKRDLQRFLEEADIKSKEEAKKKKDNSTKGPLLRGLKGWAKVTGLDDLTQIAIWYKKTNAVFQNELNQESMKIVHQMISGAEPFLETAFGAEWKNWGKPEAKDKPILASDNLQSFRNAQVIDALAELDIDQGSQESISGGYGG